MATSTEDGVVTPAERYLRSSFYEQLVEHVFISDLLQEAWFRYGAAIEVLHSEVDSSGYDVVLECNGIVRHVQLKTSEAGSRTAKQLLNVALATKPSGCVIWIVREDDQATRRMRFRYRFFGAGPGQPLPSIAELPVAKHAKANAQGVKTLRPAIRVLARARFEEVEDAAGLLRRLFALPCSSHGRQQVR